MMNVKKLSVIKKGRQVYFDALVEYEDEYEWENFRTADDGAGLWVWRGQWEGWKQIAGTCDICFRQKSKSGLYKAFMRYCESR